MDTPAPLHASTFQVLFDTAPDAMIVCDASGSIVLANPQAERLFGYERGQLSSISIDMLIPEQARGRHQQHRARYAAQPRVRPMGTGQELSGLRRDGSVFPVEIALSPIESADGRFIVASIRDISETQRARQALARARYDAVVAEVGRLLLQSANQDAAYENVPALVTQELGAEAVAIVLTQPQSGAVRVRTGVGLTRELQQLLPHLLSSDKLATAQALRPDAGIVRIRADEVDDGALGAELAAAGYREFVAAPMFDRSRPMGALIAAARSTDSFDSDKIHFLQSVAILIAATLQRNRTEEQLAHAQRLDAVGQLTGGVAHDFNNMLTVISGNLQLLEIDLADRPDSLEILGSALRAVGRGSGLTRKLLAFAGRQRLNPQAIDPRRLLNELGPILSRTLGETVTVEVDCPAGLPNVFVDPGELDTAILNLALNARDAMPRGGTLHLSLQEQGVVNAEGSLDLAPGHYVVISVRDTGLGMSPEVLARAFEPFFTTKDIGRGSGLGLSMVYGFVKQSGGHLVADSRLGYGTRIDLYLPAVRPDETAAAAMPAATPASAGRETILVVEDESEVRAVAVAFLRSLGYATLEAADAEEALKLIPGHPEISLLFSDVILGSGMKGNELARAARGLRPSLPALLTSGYEHHLAADAATANLPLLRKPYQRQDLATAVRGAMDRRG